MIKVRGGCMPRGMLAPNFNESTTSHVADSLKFRARP